MVNVEEKSVEAERFVTHLTHWTMNSLGWQWCCSVKPLPPQKSNSLYFTSRAVKSKLTPAVVSLFSSSQGDSTSCISAFFQKSRTEITFWPIVLWFLWHKVLLEEGRRKADQCPGVFFFFLSSVSLLTAACTCEDATRVNWTRGRSEKQFYILHVVQ